MVIYEFVLETLDYYEGCGDNPDIIDTSGYDNIIEAHLNALKSDLPWRIALRRDVGDDLEGIMDRAYAYPDANGFLPEFFSYGAGEEGPRIPVVFRRHERSRPKMTLQDAMRVLSRNGFLSYFGPGYRTPDAIHSFMSKYPRGKGLKQGMKNEIKLYEACLAYQQNRSRTKNYVKSA